MTLFPNFYLFFCTVVATRAILCTAIPLPGLQRGKYDQTVSATKLAIFWTA